jgi:hypothetical protein
VAAEPLAKPLKERRGEVNGPPAGGAVFHCGLVVVQENAPDGVPAPLEMEDLVEEAVGRLPLVAAVAGSVTPIDEEERRLEAGSKEPLPGAQ